MLEIQIAQQASSSSRLLGMLLGQPKTNPREHCKAVSLRSGVGFDESNLTDIEIKDA